MTKIKLHNTKTRRKEVFEPIDRKNVRMYVCGPTVYDRAHLGNARPVVVFDVLYRLLRHVYGAEHVTYVRNFTDVDDKINARAAETGRPIGDITAETTQWFLDDMGALGALQPDHMPRATAYIPQMVAMIETLISRGFAYTAPISFGHNSRAVYFDSSKAPEHAFFEVSKYKNYGDFSGQSVDEMIAGARAETGEGKRNPMDFVLWKPSKPDEPYWESPWGLGRPGWHIECSAMSKALLGDVFDIHGGGLDLQFPHHENEIAQSCCANQTDEMAKFWMHNEMLQVEGKKMSKSLGNFFTVRDLLDQGVPGEVIRFVFLSTHYRKPMDWTAKKAEEAKRVLTKWKELTSSITYSDQHEIVGPRQVPTQILSALFDDLNTPQAISDMHKMAKDARNDFEAAIQLAASLEFLGFDSKRRWANTFGFSFGKLFEDSPIPFEELERMLSEARSRAMQTKDFSEADRIKNVLLGAGLEVRISKDEITIDVTEHFDPSKLEALK